MCVCVGGEGGDSISDGFYLKLHEVGHACLPTLDPDVGGSHDGKHKEKEDEYEGLQVVGRHSLHTVEDRTK